MNVFKAGLATLSMFGLVVAARVSTSALPQHVPKSAAGNVLAGRKSGAPFLTVIPYYTNASRDRSTEASAAQTLLVTPRLEIQEEDEAFVFEVRETIGK